MAETKPPDIDTEALAKAVAAAVVASHPPAPVPVPVPAPVLTTQSWFSDNKMLGVIGAALIAMMVWVFQDTKEEVEANRAGIGELTRNVDKLVDWADTSNKKLDARANWMALQDAEAERSRMTDMKHDRELAIVKEQLGKAK